MKKLKWRVELTDCDYKGHHINVFYSTHSQIGYSYIIDDGVAVFVGTITQAKDAAKIAIDNMR